MWMGGEAYGTLTLLSSLEKITFTSCGVSIEYTWSPQRSEGLRAPTKFKAREHTESRKTALM
jgi:hypothetical protein